MRRGADSDGKSPGQWVVWLAGTDHPTVRFVREVVSTVVVVALIGAVLFLISGVWPPLVAVESGSMEPHMFRGDLVFVVAPSRFAGSAQGASDGIITRDEGEAIEYSKFGEHGDVIVYRPNGGSATPVIHRAHFWVHEGENWVIRADSDALNGDTCGEVQFCPAPNDGFITKGDANQYYDQVVWDYRPVRQQWITGRAAVRIPWLGYVRLLLNEYPSG